MIGSHDLDASTLDLLASGGGGPRAIEELIQAQVSKHLMLIGAALSHWPGPTTQRDDLVDILESARRRDSTTYRRVIGAPLVGAWAAIVNRAIRAGTVEPTDLSHLSALAIVAAAATGLDATAAVPVRAGVVAVPGWGCATVPATTARLTARDGGLIVHSGRNPIAVSETDAPQWQAVRHLASANPTYRVALDDLDPFRHGHHVPPASRLAPSEVQRWRGLFSQAWTLLADRIPERAAELATGLRTLIPLADADDGSALSATLRHTFGAFGLTRPATPAEFAVTLVHEFQHSKLSAIIDITPLIEPGERRRYFAPWREDPRPLAGLLQGVYAFVAVADTWRALRGVDAVAATADVEFAKTRLMVDSGLTSVERSAALTRAGAALAVGLRATTDQLLAEPVSTAVAREAAAAVARIRERWRLRHEPT
jgi:uncharacterized protein